MLLYLNSNGRANMNKKIVSIPENLFFYFVASPYRHTNIFVQDIREACSCYLITLMGAICVLSIFKMEAY